MINSLNMKHMFLQKSYTLVIKKKSVKSEKIKICPLVCSKYLSSWTGLGRSGHVRFQTFNPIWHVSGSKIGF